MAQQEENKKILTWQEKLSQGLPLNNLDDTKAEADYNVRRHLREQRERAAFEARKGQPRPQGVPAPQANPESKGE